MTCWRTRTGRGASRPLLPLLFAVLCVAMMTTTTGVRAVTMQLHSGDYVFAPRTAVEHNVVKSHAKHCVVVGLDADDMASALVRFRYRSNVTTPHLRLPLVLTVHRPDDSDRNVAMLTDVSHVAAVHVYDAVDLHKRDESRRAQPGATASSQTQTQRASEATITFTFRPDASQMQGDADAVEGTYAVCFALDPGSLRTRRAAPSAIIERVDIDVVEAASSRPRGRAVSGNNNDNNKTGRVPQTPRTQLGDDVTDPDGAYARALRRIYGVSGEVSVEDLVYKPDVVSSHEMSRLSEQLQELQSMMHDIMRTTSWAEQRDARMRRTSESTFTRLWVSALCIVAVMMGVVWYTFHYTKSIIVKRKLI